tara:strand:- start:1564 stop:2004 length:441 start_codon:yes stop_codon:yes gene_type:complete
MLLISHRGNMFGANKLMENSPEYIAVAIENGYNVEIDVWNINGQMYLGHDFPEHEIDVSFLKNDSLLCHAKNIAALVKMRESDDIHCFWHENDKYTITSKGIVLSYPGFVCKIENSIIMRPEDYCGSIDGAYAICSDFIDAYRGKR